MRQEFQFVVAAARAFVVELEGRSQRDPVAVDGGDFELFILRLIVFAALVVAQLAGVGDDDAVAGFPGFDGLFDGKRCLAS